jgi:ribosomal protein S18 acetylase RimI-like enzyme
LANSVLREQKGYAKKRAFVYSHLGLGDMFWMNGAVRYLATAYDEVLVVCKKRNQKNAAAMYADDPSIKLLLIEDDIDLHPWPQKSQYFSEQGYMVYSCGQHALKPDRAIYDLPNCFYDDMMRPRAVRTVYFHVPRTLASKELRDRFGEIKYIVVHEESSVQNLSIAKQLMRKGETRLILDLNKNAYTTSHGWWAAAEKVGGLPLLDYVDLIEGAEEIHMIESSIYCMASHLNLLKVKRRVCYDPWGGNSERLGVFETGTVVEDNLVEK